MHYASIALSTHTHTISSTLIYDYKYITILKILKHTEMNLIMTHLLNKMGEYRTLQPMQDSFGS
jgi:hypothetical protein